MIEIHKRDSSLDYIYILRSLMEIPFQVGKNLLADFLIGDYKNKSIISNNLDELNNFGKLDWNKNKIIIEIDSLVKNGMIELSVSDYNSFIKVLKLTIRGRNEITNPTLPSKKLKNKVGYNETKISTEDKERFKEMDFFLNEFNDKQKKSIISEYSKILCVAGAGSGKTTVLTKRIEFLVKYKGIDPRKILAITFTRKARLEMEKRLHTLGVQDILVHTFNSFCEGILRKYEAEIYGRQIRVQSYADKILAMNMALGNLGIDMGSAIDDYYTPSQKKFKTGNQLVNGFMNDCFSVMDYFKVTGNEHFDFSIEAEMKNKRNAKMIYEITKYLKDHMKMQGLRDYSDQLIDAINFLKVRKDAIPNFEYVLVDEYQDVNAMQIDLIDLIDSNHLFAVGDPRQSIFGWRGSNINYILDFEKKYSEDEVEVINLTINYRSSKEIVKFMNNSISELGLQDLEHHNELTSKIEMNEFDSEELERTYIVNKILTSEYSRDQIFVLARTNRQLMELSSVMKVRGINHVVKTDEVRDPKEGSYGDVILATIHAIKGLEAKVVFVIGCNEQNFPCKASDHPAIEMIKTEDYDKIEEERRIFYVAISRAKEILYLTYVGKKPTYFITDSMLLMLGQAVSKSSTPRLKEKILSEDIDERVLEELTVWRREISLESKLPAYTILTNSTIEGIAMRLPNDADELIKVDGIGPAKLVRYGKKILEIVNQD